MELLGGSDTKSGMASLREWTLNRMSQVWDNSTVTAVQCWGLAQSVEHAAVNRSVVGSSPTGGAFLFSDFKQRAQWFSKMKAIVFFVILLYKSEAIGIY